MGDCHLSNITKLGEKKTLLCTMSFFIYQSSCKNNWCKFLPLGDRKKKIAMQTFQRICFHRMAQSHTTVEEKIKLKSPYLGNKFQDVAKT
jgi:hypothetical protein